MDPMLSMDNPLPEDLNHMKVWILHDGRAGHLNQSKGVAAALGIRNAEVMTLYTRKFGSLLGLLYPPWRYERPPTSGYPDMVIATGYQTSFFTRWIKRISPTTFTVQMMNPSGEANEYDVVATPLHDRPRAHGNLVTTLGAANIISPTLLKQEGERWESRLRQCPSPRLAVLVGGNSKRFKLTTARAKQLAEEVTTIAKQQGFSLLVTASRRTGEAQTDIIRHTLQHSGVPFYFWNGQDITSRDNPLLAYLHTAEAVVVTADSISMVSEACTAGKPVYVWGKQWMKLGKFKLFYDVLEGQKRAVPLTEKLTLRAPDFPLTDTETIAGFIRGQLLQR